MAETKEKFVEKDPWKDLVNVYIPKTSEGDEDAQFVSINNRDFLIKKNVDVAVPRPVAVLLKQRSKAIRTSEIIVAREQEKFLKQP